MKLPLLRLTISMLVNFKGLLVEGTEESSETLEITDGEFRAPIKQNN